MAMPSSGEIKFSQLQTEFGGSNPIALSEYYGKGNAPASGEIQLGADFYGTSSFEITRSAVFNNSNGYLYWTPSTTGDRRRYTLSVWLTRTSLSTPLDKVIMSTSSGRMIHYFHDSFANKLGWYPTAGSGGNQEYVSSTAYTTLNQWYHVVYSVDTTLGSNNARVKLYVDGSLVSWQQGQVSQNLSLGMNLAGSQNRIGQENNGRYYAGLMSQFYLIDGQALAPTEFGYNDGGTWKAKAYTGSFGTNGYYLKFENNGNDSSGNGNNFTPVNITYSSTVPPF